MKVGNLIIDVFLSSKRGGWSWYGAKSRGRANQGMTLCKLLSHKSLLNCYTKVTFTKTNGLV